MTNQSQYPMTDPKVSESANEDEEGAGGLLTLAEVARRSGISVPTLQRYKRLHGARIPTQGEGRSQRYPEQAVTVFQRIKQENLERNSLPRPGGRLLSLTAQRRAAEQAQKARDAETAESAESASRAAPATTGSPGKRPLDGRRDGAPARRSQAASSSGDGKVREWDAETAGMERRIAALEKAQLRLEREIRSALEELEAPWVGSLEGLL